MYAPGITYHGDEYFYRAISGLGRDIGGAIEDYKKTKAAGKAADAIYDYIDTSRGDGEESTMNPNPLGPKEWWQTLGAKDKAARVQGMIQAQAMQAAKQSLLQDAIRAKQQNELFPLQKQEAEQRLAAQQRQATGSAALQQAIFDANFRNNTGYGGFPGRTPPAMNGQMLMEAIGRNSAAMDAPRDSVGGTVLNDLLRAEADRKTAFFNPESGMVKRDPTAPGWMQLITGPNTSQWAPDYSDGVKASPVEGAPEGTVAVPSGRGLTVIKPPDTSKGQVTERDQFKQLEALHRAYVANAGKSFTPEQQQYWNTKADEVSQEMNNFVGGKQAAEKSEKPMALPKSKSEMKKGKLYQTARGVAR